MGNKPESEPEPEGVLTDEEFGEFTFDRFWGCYKGEVPFIWGPTEVNFDVEGPQPCEGYFKILGALKQAEEQWKRDLESVLKKSMFHTRNDWAEESEFPQVTEEEFVASLVLRRLVIHDNGYLEFHFDEPVFEETGHGMVVRFWPTKGELEAVLEG